MRLLLLLIAVTGGLIWASPGFRLLWEMETGAARIDMIHGDGAQQRSTSGPQSFLPDWTPRPANATIKVQSHYSAAPGHPATGFAKVALQARAAVVQADYAQMLAAKGWKVALSYQDIRQPGLPPRTQRLCHVIAHRGARSIMLSIADNAPEFSRLYWREAPQPAMQGAISGSC